MEPEFIIDEQPSSRPTHLRDAAVAVLQREHATRQSLAEKNLSFDDELFQMRKFLKALLDAEETRCARLIRTFRERMGDETDAQAGIWLSRLESVHKALEGVLLGFGVTSYSPTGMAVSGRDDIQNTVSDSGLEPGTIVRVIKPAYLWRGEVLSPAVVLVAE